MSMPAGQFNIVTNLHLAVLTLGLDSEGNPSGTIQVSLLEEYPINVTWNDVNNELTFSYFSERRLPDGAVAIAGGEFQGYLFEAGQPIFGGESSGVAVPGPTPPNEKVWTMFAGTWTSAAPPKSTSGWIARSLTTGTQQFE